MLEIGKKYWFKEPIEDKQILKFVTKKASYHLYGTREEVYHFEIKINHTKYFTKSVLYEMIKNKKMMSLSERLKDLFPHHFENS
jgi:hypothetical protein